MFRDGRASESGMDRLYHFVVFGHPVEKGKLVLGPIAGVEHEYLGPRAFADYLKVNSGQRESGFNICYHEFGL